MSKQRYLVRLAHLLLSAFVLFSRTSLGDFAPVPALFSEEEELTQNKQLSDQLEKRLRGRRNPWQNEDSRRGGAGAEILETCHLDEEGVLTCLRPETASPGATTQQTFVETRYDIKDLDVLADLCELGPSLSTTDGEPVTQYYLMPESVRVRLKDRILSISVFLLPPPTNP